MLYKFSDNAYLTLGRFDDTLSDEEKVQLGTIMIAGLTNTQGIGQKHPPKYVRMPLGYPYRNN